MKYHKIWNAHDLGTERGPDYGKPILDKWFRPEFEELQDNTWTWTEKLDGTNIRIIWDGHKVRIGGRTDDALIPTAVVHLVQDLFPEHKMEQQFGATPVFIYGEGLMPGLNGSFRYTTTAMVIAFDVKVGDWWLQPDGVIKACDQLGIPVAHNIGAWSPNDMIAMVGKGMKSRYNSAFYAEGVVGTPPHGITGRDGDRLKMKIKHEHYGVGKVNKPIAEQ